MPQHALGVVYVLMFLMAIVIHGRQVEWTARLDFLWQVQVISCCIDLFCVVVNETCHSWFEIICLCLNLYPDIFHRLYIQELGVNK